ncbi:MAG TPA: tetratricopeptide repeat protein [Candidatus Omnitrophica bacterium]|nr:tetratricopeptide repeat protein [Candidatus Omnitrophota bacterium]
MVYLIVSYITSFIASFCIMVLEITAGRLIARYVGTSLYTWTSVIGVVLGGISFGNYIGGRLADRFSPKKTLCILFILGSIGCAFIPLLNNSMGNSEIPIILPLPLRVFLHVLIIFFLPSALLGVVSPVVTKFALEQNFSTGKTVGNVYAFGALGSIMGTFLTGFFLIAKLGTSKIIWMTAFVLGVMGLAYGLKSIFSYIWIFILMFLIYISLSNQVWAKIFGEKLFLREITDPRIIYQKESPYYFINVKDLTDINGMRFLYLDQLIHSKIFMKDPANIDMRAQYEYIKMYGAILDYFAKYKKKINILCIGGGGYVFPRHIRKKWPESYVEVVEIDPEVTRTAFDFLGVSPDDYMKIYHLDARNYIDEALRVREKNLKFDFIYNDAINGIVVPFQLTTYEFNEKISKLLKPEGIYVLNLIDSLSEGNFLGAEINTLKKVFPYVYVFSVGGWVREANAWETFVLIASFEKLDFKSFSPFGFVYSQLDDSQIKLLKRHSNSIILTDDYAPVENLLAPVVRKRGVFLVCSNLMAKGNTLVFQGELNEAIRWYRKVLKINPEFAKAYDNIGVVLARQGKIEEAIEYYEKALRNNPNLVEAYNNLGNALARQGKTEKAKMYYRQALEKDPYYPEIYNNLANLLARQGKIDEAIKHYEKALRIDFNHPEIYNNLGNALVRKGDFQGAVSCYKKALEIKPDFKEAQYNLSVVLKELEKIEK